MKKSLIALFLLLALFHNSLSAQYSNQDIALYLPLDSLATDLGRSNYEVEIVGTPAIVDGIVGNAMFFDGVDDCLLIQEFNNTNCMEESFTINAWIKPLGVHFDRWLTLLTHVTPEEETTPFSIIYDLRFRKMVPYVRFTGPTPNTWSIETLLNSSNSVEFGEWNFITWRFNYGEISIFLNATLIGTFHLEHEAVLASAGILEIGRDSPGRQEYFHGMVDELSFFKTALSNEEIEELHNLGVSGKPLALNLTSTTSPLLEQQKIVIYPNPASIQISVAPEGNYSYQLFDLKGRKVKESQGQSVNVTGLASGIYYLKIDQHKLKKVVIQSTTVYP